MNIKNVWLHLRKIQTHRKWVRHYCFGIGLYKQGLFHDLSKYSPTEFWESVKYYQGTSSPIDEFDVEKGKEVARNKALMSYYKDMEYCMYEVSDLFHKLHKLAAEKAEECYLYEERLAIRQENF